MPLLNFRFDLKFKNILPIVPPSMCVCGSLSHTVLLILQEGTKLYFQTCIFLVFFSFFDLEIAQGQT